MNDVVCPFNVRRRNKKSSQLPKIQTKRVMTVVMFHINYIYPIIVSGVMYVQPKTVPCSGNAEIVEVTFTVEGPHPTDFKKMFGGLGWKPTEPSFPALAGHTAKVSAIGCGSIGHLRLISRISIWEWTRWLPLYNIDLGEKTCLKMFETYQGNCSNSSARMYLSQ